jgi:hypothetical protein
MDAFAVEYIAVHDRPPIEVPHGKGCACWTAIARQIALGLFPLIGANEILTIETTKSDWSQKSLPEAFPRRSPREFDFYSPPVHAGAPYFGGCKSP